jgi:hypothetical protein
MSRQEIMQHVRREVAAVIEPMARAHVADGHILHFFHLRTRSAGLRSYFGYEVARSLKAPLQEVIPFLAAVELSIISQYAFNQILDNKSYGNEPEEVRRMVIGGNLAKDLMNQAILQNYQGERAERLLSVMNEVHRLFYHGQYLHNIYWPSGGTKVFADAPFEVPEIVADLAGLCLDGARPKAMATGEWEAFRRRQILRLYLVNGHFFGAISRAIVTEWGGAWKREVASFERAGCMIGISEMVVNDFMDFMLPSLEVESSFKTVGDFFSDLKGGVETLPLFLALHNPGATTTRIMWEKAREGCASLTMEDMAASVAELCGHGILRTTLEVAARMMQHAFQQFPSTWSPADGGLMELRDMPFRNKYFTHLAQWWRARSGKRL